jgi:hypothetical protein
MLINFFKNRKYHGTPCIVYLEWFGAQKELLRTPCIVIRLLQKRWGLRCFLFNLVMVFGVRYRVVFVLPVCLCII